MSGPARLWGAPKSIGRYRLRERLGAGGMGTVYRAIDRRTGETVAIKVLHSHLAADKAFLERFRREAYIASLLNSPNVVRVLDSGSDRDHNFIAYEYIEGVKLGDILSEGRLDPVQALAIASQVANALEEANQKGIVHRDIKPDNIIFTGAGLVKVTDFGIGRIVDFTRVTVTGQFLGTMSHTAPEQARGQSDTRSDIYALGVTLFEMLSGELPFKSDTPTGLMRMHEETPPPLEKLAGVPSAAAQVTARCLEKDPANRFQTPAELKAAIEKARLLLAEPVTETWIADASGDLAATRIGLPATQIGGNSGANVPPVRRNFPGVGDGHGRWMLAAVAVATVAAIVSIGAALALSGGSDSDRSNDGGLVFGTHTPAASPSKTAGTPTSTGAAPTLAPIDPSPSDGPGGVQPPPDPPIQTATPAPVTAPPSHDDPAPTPTPTPAPRDYVQEIRDFFAAVHAGCPSKNAPAGALAQVSCTYTQLASDFAQWPSVETTYGYYLATLNALKASNSAYTTETWTISNQRQGVYLHFKDDSGRESLLWTYDYGMMTGVASWFPDGNADDDLQQLNQWWIDTGARTR